MSNRFVVYFLFIVLASVIFTIDFVIDFNSVPGFEISLPDSIFIALIIACGSALVFSPVFLIFWYEDNKASQGKTALKLSVFVLFTILVGLVYRLEAKELNDFLTFLIVYLSAGLLIFGLFSKQRVKASES